MRGRLKTVLLCMVSTFVAYTFIVHIIMSILTRKNSNTPTNTTSLLVFLIISNLKWDEMFISTINNCTKNEKAKHKLYFTALPWTKSSEAGCAQKLNPLEDNSHRHVILQIWIPKYMQIINAYISIWLYRANAHLLNLKIGFLRNV